MVLKQKATEPLLLCQTLRRDDKGKISIFSHLECWKGGNLDQVIRISWVIKQ